MDTCQGETKCKSNVLCKCLPDGIKTKSSVVIDKQYYKVMWQGLTIAYCRTVKQAIAKAKKLNKAKGDTRYFAVRITDRIQEEKLCSE